MDRRIGSTEGNSEDEPGITIADLVLTASRQQDPKQARDCRLQVLLRRPGQEAQGYQRGAFLHSTSMYLSSHLLTWPLQVNPDIVGGLVVEVGDRTIDLSVSSRIAKMNKLLNDTL